MNSPAEIRQLADQRLLEAKLLLVNSGITFFEGVYYLAGYCIELYLKAKICESLDLDDLFSDTSTAKKIAGTFKSHRLEELMLLSGLSKKFEIAKAPNLPLATSWSHITKWNESKRYLPLGTISRTEAEKLIESIEHPQNGFLQWIRLH